MSDTLKLGKIIDSKQHRDAIHIAVAPVIAADNEILYPSQAIGFVEPGNTEKVGVRVESIGIVDPFLTGRVFPGQSFWLFLYPNTITSLRHEWTHPAFENLKVLPVKTEAQGWIEAFAVELGQTYESLMEAANILANKGEYTYDNSEKYKDVASSKWVIFWDHYKTLSGKTIEDPEDCPFTCSC